MYLANWSNLQSPLEKVFSDDIRNHGVEVKAHYKGFVDSSVLVFDLQDVSGSSSRADVFRVFLQYADKMQDEYFDEVELAFRGETRFKIDGYYFRTLGREYGTQNVMYTIRTFPENLKLPYGTSAYSTWSGGVLGVLKEQIDDFNDFHDKWYMNEL